jgi:hypothetical protein
MRTFSKFFVSVCCYLLVTLLFFVVPVTATAAPPENPETVQVKPTKPSYVPLKRKTPKPAITPSVEPKVTPILQPVRGDCNSLNAFIRDIGITVGKAKDGKNLTSPTVDGHTTFNFSSNVKPGKITHPKGEICAIATIEPNVFLIENLTMRRLDWDTVTTDQKCLVERQRWIDGVVRHENRHISDAEAIRDEANEEWSKRTREFKVCAGNLKDADSELQSAINEEVKKAKEKSKTMADDYKTREDIFHNSPEGKTNPVDCSICEC